MLLIITGNGKGKTTSAIGTAFRAAGWKQDVGVIFFDKGGSHYGEQKIFDLLQGHGASSMGNEAMSQDTSPMFQGGKLEVFRFGLKRFDEESQKFRFENEPGDFEEGKKAVDKARELLQKNYDLIICDELINTLNYGLTPEEDVRALVEACPESTHLVLTGRNVPEWLAEKADLISEVKEVKHYYKKVKEAIKGIDY